MGWLKPRVEEKVTEEPDKVMTRKYYELWAKEDSVSFGHSLPADQMFAVLQYILCCVVSCNHYNYSNIFWIVVLYV